MAHFTESIDAVGGPLITVFVGVSKERREILEMQKLPVPAAVQAVALVDTGASCSCVAPEILSPLRLTPKGTIPVHTPSTGTVPHMAEEYDVSILIPGGYQPHHLPLTLQTVPVVGASIAGADALIGRDILSDCVLVYNGTAQTFTLAF